VAQKLIKLFLEVSEATMPALAFFPLSKNPFWTKEGSSDKELCSVSLTFEVPLIVDPEDLNITSVSNSR